MEEFVGNIMPISRCSTNMAKRKLSQRYNSKQIITFLIIVEKNDSMYSV